MWQFGDPTGQKEAMKQFTVQQRLKSFERKQVDVGKKGHRKLSRRLAIAFFDDEPNEDAPD